MFRKFSHWFDTPPTDKSAYLRDGKACEYPGCSDEGIYRAPKSRYHLETAADDWYWFCLTHIREYNAKWNYYSNMSESEIEKERRADITWQRPTWPLGASTPHEKEGVGLDGQHFQDPFGLFNDPGSSSQRQERFPAQSPEGKALSVLELSYPFTQLMLRQRYRELVKKYHPDTNGSSPEALEKIKRINEAYEILKKIYT